MKKSSKKTSGKSDSKSKLSKRDPFGFIIGGCTLLGLGVGFLVGQVPGALFVGLGVGLLSSAAIAFFRK